MLQYTMENNLGKQPDQHDSSSDDSWRCMVSKSAKAACHWSPLASTVFADGAPSQGEFRQNHHQTGSPVPWKLPWKMEDDEGCDYSDDFD